MRELKDWKVMNFRICKISQSIIIVVVVIIVITLRG